MKTICFLCFTLFLVRCTFNHENEKIPVVNETVYVDMEEIKDIAVTKAKYLKSTKYVQLETNINSLIGEITKIVLGDNRIFILDQFISKAVFIFDFEGQFVNKIDCRGESPEEYIDILNIYYDKLDSTINIIAPTQYTKIMSFNKDGGILLKQIPVNMKFFEIQRNKARLYIINSNSLPTVSGRSFDLTILSDRLEKMYTAFPIKAELEGRLCSIRKGLYENYKGDIFYSPKMSTDVYKVNSDTLSHIIQYDFGKYNCPDEFKQLQYLTYPSKINVNDYITEIRDFYETENYYEAIILHRGSYKMIIYDKQEKKCELFSLIDSPLLLDGFGLWSGISDHYMIATKEVNSYVSLFNNIEYSHKESIKELKKLFKRPLNEDDNPIIILYDLDS